jgi:hypothetical protein
MEVPMLDEEEFAIAKRLYGEAFGAGKTGMSIEERFQPVVDYYKEVTGFDAENENVVMHHRTSQYGPLCESCGKPYRTPEASFCAECGNGRR